MSLGPLYKKFSVDVNDPTEGMMASQMGVRRGIQDAIGGIQSILDRQDEQAKKHNTRLATQELKQRIQEGGLGADPIDINELGQGYYDLVDYDILENVQERQTNLLKTNALDNAASTAATVYDNSNDLIKSSQAFKDSLIAAGMGDTAANKEMSICGLIFSSVTTISSVLFCSIISGRFASSPRQPLRRHASSLLVL